MKIFYKETRKSNILLSYTETEKDAKILYGKNYKELEVDINTSNQYLFKTEKGEIIVKDSIVENKPKLTEEEKEDKRQNFKINIIANESKYIAQRCLNKLNQKRYKKEMTMKQFKGSHRELLMILTLLNLGDIRGVWLHLKGVIRTNKQIPEDILTFITNKTRRLLKNKYPKFPTKL